MSSNQQDSPIIYSLVAYKTTILCEYSSTKGNFQQVALPILAKISSKGQTKTSYLYDEYVIHILTDKGYTFLCMALKRFGNRKPFAYLSSIRDRFISQYPNAKNSATKMGLQRDFKPTLKNQVKAFEKDKLNTVHNQLDEVKGIMVQNIDKVLERGNRIEVLVDATDDLGESANHFRFKSNKLKNAMWRRNLALLCVLLMIIVVVVIVITWLACGWTFDRCISIFQKKDDGKQDPKDQ